MVLCSAAVGVLDPFVDGASRRARFAVANPVAAPLPRHDGLLAGAAEVDITPPPGMPKAGYSSNAHLGDGFRTRLRARVVHLRSGATSLALVQCDLLGGSSVLHHLVARQIADLTDVPIAGLYLGATHTHAGPGQFLGTDFYNRFASNKAGFDPAWTAFLAGRIAEAVISAVASRRPARAAFGRTEVWGLTRNRSLDPHVHNENVHDERLEPQRKFLAINPWLHLLRVDAEAAGGGTEPLAAMAVFSVHGTGVPQQTREYNADVWAYLVGELAHRIEASTGHRPVVGAVEGTHADVAPALRPGCAGHVEAARVGRGIGEEAAALYQRLEGELHGELELGCGIRELQLDRSHEVDGIRIASRPAVGAALVAGAMENLTPVVHRFWPFRAGRPRRRPAGEQGVKHVLGSVRGQALLLPLRSFPRVVPLQVLRIGDVALAALPFEITVEAGRRIERAAADALGASGVQRVVVASVANEYFGYVTTPEEYSRQYYEGGHTLYGPNTQPFLAAHIGRLAREVGRTGLVDDRPVSRRFDLRVRRFLPAGGGARVARRFLDSPAFTDPTASRDGYWEVTWLDVEPGDLAWHEPLVRVESVDGDHDVWQAATHAGHLVDDQGWALEVTHLGPGDEGHRYRVRWWDPAFRGGRRHRFVLLPNAAQPALSGDPFD